MASSTLGDSEVNNVHGYRMHKTLSAAGTGRKAEVWMCVTNGTQLLCDRLREEEEYNQY